MTTILGMTIELKTEMEREMANLKAVAADFAANQAPDPSVNGEYANLRRAIDAYEKVLRKHNDFMSQPAPGQHVEFGKISGHWVTDDQCASCREGNC